MTVLTQTKLFELDGRKAYAAQVLGPDSKYGAEREFCGKRYSVNGRRGLWAKITAPGWYETQSRTHFGSEYKRTAFSFDGALFIEYDKWAVKFMPIAATGPAPGEPGAWNSETCECGDEVAHYTPDGFPVCEKEECHARQ